MASSSIVLFDLPVTSLNRDILPWPTIIGSEMIGNGTSWEHPWRTWPPCERFHRVVVPILVSFEKSRSTGRTSKVPEEERPLESNVEVEGDEHRQVRDQCDTLQEALEVECPICLDL